jgi:nucleotide-binding universal stress UspA family protein
VRVLAVVEPLPLPASELWYDGRRLLETDQRELKKNTTEFIEKVSAKLKKLGHTIEAVVRGGHPQTAIVDEAKKWRADLIVLGSHGRTGLTRLLMGSVAQSVVIHAPCSVEVMRLKKTRKAR